MSISIMVNRIHIALSPWDLTDSYNRHTGTTIASILENCSEPVTVHLLYEGRLSSAKLQKTADTMQMYQKLGAKYNAEILFHDISLPNWVNDAGRKNLQHFTPGALLRLYLTEVVSVDVKKIIYFDCDMIVLTDIANIWNISLGNKLIGAVLDAGRDASISYYCGKVDRYGINRRKYFNTGFLLLNLEEMRKIRDFPNVVMKMIFEHMEYLYPDQDALNILFQENDTLFLDVKYNIPVGLRMTDYRLNRELGITNHTYNDCILHFNGTKKPWKIYSGSVDEYYWYYLRKTPWGEDSAQINTMYEEVRGTKKSIIDRIMSTPLNRYFRLAESIVKKQA